MELRVKKFFILLLVILNISLVSFAHSGRTDANGGHYDRSTGEYHYHNSGYSDVEDSILWSPSDALEENQELREEIERLEEINEELNCEITELQEQEEQQKNEIKKAKTEKSNTISISFFIVIITAVFFYNLGEKSKNN